MTKRIELLALVLSIGCGGKGQAPEPTEPSEPAEGAEPADPGAGDAPAASLEGEALVGAACTKMGDVHARTPCDFLTRARFSLDGCRSEMAISKIPEPLKPAFEEAMRCIAASDQCAGFPECFAKFNQAAATATTGRECGEQGIGAVALTADEANKRYGQGVTKLSEAPSSKEQPIEVCGVAQQHDWLLAAQCDDGSSPLKAPEAAAGARVGSMGVGGRCASVIDKYVVTCPESSYDVYMDLYMCGPGESI